MPRAPKAHAPRRHDPLAKFPARGRGLPSLGLPTAIALLPASSPATVPIGPTVPEAPLPARARAATEIPDILPPIDRTVLAPARAAPAEAHARAVIKARVASVPADTRVDIKAPLPVPAIRVRRVAATAASVPVVIKVRLAVATVAGVQAATKARRAVVTVDSVRAAIRAAAMVELLALPGQATKGRAVATAGSGPGATAAVLAGPAVGMAVPGDRADTAVPVGVVLVEGRALAARPLSALARRRLASPCPGASPHSTNARTRPRRPCS